MKGSTMTIVTVIVVVITLAIIASIAMPLIGQAKAVSTPFTASIQNSQFDALNAGQMTVAQAKADGLTVSTMLSGYAAGKVNRDIMVAWGISNQDIASWCAATPAASYGQLAGNCTK